MPFNVEGASTWSSPDNGPFDEDQNAPALPPKINRYLGPA